MQILHSHSHRALSVTAVLFEHPGCKVPLGAAPSGRVPAAVNTGSACSSLNYILIWTYAQGCNCWVRGQVCFSFKDPPLFSTVTTLHPTNSGVGSPFLTPSPAFVICRHFDNDCCSPAGGLHLVAAWICVSLVIGDVEHLSMCALAICVSSLETCLLDKPVTCGLSCFCYCIVQAGWVSGSDRKENTCAGDLGSIP